MEPRRLAFWLLTTAGVAVGHILGYAVAHPDAAGREVALGGHAYLPTTATVVVPLGVVAALVWAVRSCRDLGLRGQLSWRHLAAAQVAVFAVQEVGERAVSASSAVEVLHALVTERGVWLGLVAQVLVAWLAVHGVDLVRRVARFVQRGARALGARVRSAPTFLVVPAPALAATTVAVGLRAPPVVGQPR